MRGVPSLPRQLLAAIGTWLLGLLVLFEEWGWRPLVRLLGLLARLPAVARLERFVAALRPAVAVIVLFVPALLLLPAKLGAVWLIAGGRLLWGVTTLVAAKLLGTAVVARLFLLMRPQLLRLGWFARVYQRWSAWKAQALARIRASLAWRLARVFRRRVFGRRARA